jgi:hypothetical protein
MSQAPARPITLAPDAPSKQRDGQVVTADTPAFAEMTDALRAQDPPAELARILHRYRASPLHAELVQYAKLMLATAR